MLRMTALVFAGALAFGLVAGGIAAVLLLPPAPEPAVGAAPSAGGAGAPGLRGAIEAFRLHDVPRVLPRLGFQDGAERTFSLADFRDQMMQLKKLGSMESLLGMLPAMGPMKALKNAKVDEKEISRIVAIIDSMTPKERNNHMIINGTRRRRISKGSGTSVQEVNTLLKQYAEARKMMKAFTGSLSGQGFLGKKLAKFKLPGNLADFKF